MGPGNCELLRHPKFGVVFGKIAFIRKTDYSRHD